MEISIMDKRMIIQEELKAIEKQQIALEKSLLEIRKKCNHDITITASQINKENGKNFVRRTHTFCLFCREHLSPRRLYPEELSEKLKKAVDINMGNYPEIMRKWNETYMEELEKMYGALSLVNKDKSEQEIAEIMKKRLEALETI